MIKYRFLILIFIALVITSCTNIKIVQTQYIGDWQALSKVLYSVYGDLEVKQNTLSFTILGDFQYRVSQSEKNYVILEANGVVDCGSIIKLSLFEGKSMEFSVYKKMHSENQLCSRGVYIKNL